MVSEEYSKPKYYFWSDCLKFLATIPAILMFTCLWLYYHGTHRVGYIHMYTTRDFYLILGIIKLLWIG